MVTIYSTEGQENILCSMFKADANMSSNIVYLYGECLPVENIIVMNAYFSCQFDIIIILHVNLTYGYLCLYLECDFTRQTKKKSYQSD